MTLEKQIAELRTENERLRAELKKLEAWNPQGRKARERDAALAPIIAEIRAAGVTDHGELAAALNDRGLLTPRGLLWTARNIRHKLDRIDAEGTA